MTMRRGTIITSLLLLLVLIFLVLQQTHAAKQHQQQPCPPSFCGKFRNITTPFRLKGHPTHCGGGIELDCENNKTVLHLFSGKFYVQDIDYKRYIIRLSDAGVVEDATCSFIPRYFLGYANFSFRPSFHHPKTIWFTNPDWYRDPKIWHDYDTPNTIAAGFFNCINPITDDPRYVDVNTTGGCGSGGYMYSVLQYSYLNFTMMDIKVGCQLKVATIASGGPSRDLSKKVSSYADIHNMLVYGFRLSWIHVVCELQCIEWTDCRIIDESTGVVQCFGTFNIFTGNYYWHISKGNYFRRIVVGYAYGFLHGLWDLINYRYKLVADCVRGRNLESSLLFFPHNKGIRVVYCVGEIMGWVIPAYAIVRFLSGIVAFIALLIYKWRRRHESIYENIEDFLRGNTLMPIRYSYKEIKRMSRGFKEKLGEGGFGFVYKGKLRSGPFVAIKMLSKSKGNGQDFINEVASIGRVHHANVVGLIGFCVEGSTRALVYEFMPNGSLDRYIFSKQDNVSLAYEKIYEISLGVANGIAYLHHDCEMKILHFDIKPHNILLDENFVPKVSDFGLAKLYPTDKSIVTMTGARGTLGYMAPELFYHNLGGVSHKADIYSFGMLLMEMASRRKNLNPHVEHSSQLYFPLWIYDQLIDREENIEMENLTEEEMKITKKMIIVALWCIQLKPSDRPSMHKVLEMLEGEAESIEIPPKPSLYPRETIQEDLQNITDQTLSDDSTGSTSYLE